MWVYQSLYLVYMFNEHLWVSVCVCVCLGFNERFVSHSLGGDGVPDLPAGGLLGLHYGQGRTGKAQTLTLWFLLCWILWPWGHVLQRVPLQDTGEGILILLVLSFLVLSYPSLTVFSIPCLHSFSLISLLSLLLFVYLSFPFCPPTCPWFLLTILSSPPLTPAPVSYFFINTLSLSAF